MQGAVAREEIELSFKRYILEKTEAFAHEPMEDVYRVNLLGQMLGSGEHEFFAAVTASKGFVLIHNCILLKIFTFTGWHSQ